MAIKVSCPGCRQKIRYSQAPHGSLGRCPRCAAVVLTMDDDSDASIGPAASHGAVVPRQRRQSRPADETAVFTPIFPHPVPAIPPPLAIPMAFCPAPRTVQPARRSVLSRHSVLDVYRYGGAFPAPRGFVAPDFRAPAHPVGSEVASAFGLAAMMGLSLFGAAVLGLWFVVVLTQFP